MVAQRSIEMYRPFAVAPSLAQVDFKMLNEKYGIRFAILDQDGVILRPWENTWFISRKVRKDFCEPTEEGVDNVLRALENRWLDEAGILSNTGTFLLRRRLRKTAEKMGLPYHGCEWPHPLKPDPRSADPLLAQMHIIPELTVVVGDTRKDMGLAYNLNAKGILVAAYGEETSKHRRDKSQCWDPLGVVIPKFDCTPLVYA